MADEQKKLYAATYVKQPMGRNNIWSLSDTGGFDVDTMQITDKYEDIVGLCRFFYRHDGLAYTTVSKQVEIGINSYAVNPGTCTDNELLVYEYLDDLIGEALQGFAMEYLISGLVVPEVEWGVIKGTDIHPKLRRSYQLPVGIWFRDPLTIELKRSPIPNRLTVFVKVSDDEIYFIQHEGVYPDGTEDKETYRLLLEQYPTFVAAVKDGAIKFKLENDPLVLRRYVSSGGVYPTPYLLPALELFIHKRNLRRMDYQIAARVISAIQLFKMGSDDFPLTEDDDEVVENLKTQMRWRDTGGRRERIFQLFGNHTLDISWVSPDVKALLDESKYKSVNDDLYAALGLSRVIVAGENLRSGTSNSAIAMLPPVNTIAYMRKQLLKFPKRLYKEIQNKNGLKGLPDPHYEPIRLLDLTDLTDIGAKLYELGGLSKTGLDEMANVNYETEMQRMVWEKARLEELGLEERPDVPFSNPPENTQKEKKEVKEDE